MSRSVRWLLVLAVTLGAVVRLLHLGRWSIDGDELYSWYDVQTILAGEAWPEGVRSHPLAYLGMALSVWLGGLDEWVLRVFPALCGCLAVASLAWMRPDAVPRGAALLAAWLAALSPWLVYHAQTARFYGPLLLFSCWATLWAVPGRGRRPLASGLAFAAAVLCHPSALLLGPIMVLPWWRSSSGRSRTGLVTVGLALVGGAAWMASGSDVVRDALTRSTLSDYGARQFALGLGYNVGPGTGLLALVGVIGWWVGRESPWGWLTAAAAVPVAVLFAVALTGVSTHQRYAMVAVPAMLLLAGWGGLWLTRRSRALGGLVILAGLCAPLPGLWAHHRDGNRHDVRGAADWLASQVAPDDIIVADEHATLDLYLGAAPGLQDVYLFEAPLDFEAPVDASKRVGFLRNRREIWVVLKLSRLERGYGEVFMDWVDEHFTEMTRVGSEPPPLVRHDNRLVVFRRSERQRSPPPAPGDPRSGPKAGEGR